MSRSNGNQLTGFHPAIVRWFNTHFDAPSAPQVRGWPAIQSGRDTLIAAPTGSGKTLAAFLSCIDSLLRQALTEGLTDQTQVLYVSPLKALSNDVQKNLAQPLEEIGEILQGMGQDSPEIRVLVRTGDTPSSQRQAMVRKPPHILVTTPESLYILLTSEGGRAMLETVRTVIVDEIHAVAGNKRGSHLALSLERLEALAGQRPVRIGLSATQRPIEEIARFLVGTGGNDAGGRSSSKADNQPSCAIVDEGYRRSIDLGVELPGLPLSAVCSNETWEEIYDRLADLISQKRTTLVFVNTRRLAERLTFHLSKRLGEDNVTSHHGSLSKEQRLQAEQRLKAGELKALVATASLELGIDIGTVDLVCQIGSTHSIATLLQRVGRSGHSLAAMPRGRLFPLTRDDLVECAALLSQVRRSNLDLFLIPEKPLDILAQQIVATVATGEWAEDELFHLYQRAYPYRNLTRQEYDDVCRMLSEGFSTRRGRSAAYLHYDAVGRRFRARRGARLAAVTSGGAIPETADYDVIVEPQNTLVGTVNEDFAIESLPGDIFQLGISSWRILRVEPGQLRVEDAHGLPPTIPFWIGEAPSRTDELSSAVSWLRQQLSDLLPDTTKAIRWLMEETGLDLPATEQLVEYIAAGKSALGVVPTQQTLVLERFFDESGGMQLVVHSPLGSRINRAWGLALRKRFCRTFNFELQAAASEDAIALSLGMEHSFPLEEVFSYLHPKTAKDVLVQALLAAPMFQTRWRWNTTRALAILRQLGGKKVPMPLQRMRADDLLAAVFPDSLACQENIVGDMEIPDHPLVQQTIGDCLVEAMDVEGFLRLLDQIVERRLELVARDTTEPSPFAHEILTAKPYAFLDDAPLEERRTQAVSMRRTLDFESPDELGQLDPEAIRRVREQAWPEVEDPDELHDALLVMGYLTEEEGAPWLNHFDPLTAEKRATRLKVTEGHTLWIACERLPLFEAIFPDVNAEPPVRVPARELETTWSREEALRELVRGRLEALGPVTAASLAASLGVSERDIMSALIVLEAEGFALRGHFSATDKEMEWCDRRLLARIHRYTLDRLRQEIEPVSAADFIRFLMTWHHVDPEYRLDGPMGLVAVLELLEGFEVPSAAWEAHILPSRLANYNPSWLDQLSLSGELAWARLYPSVESNGRRAGATRSSPIALVFRDNLDTYLALGSAAQVQSSHLSGVAGQVFEYLQQRGACFVQELVQATRQLPPEVEKGLGELAARGLITCDGFDGLRALISPARNRSLHRRRAQRQHGVALLPRQRSAAGRWSPLQRLPDAAIDRAEQVEVVARQLLRRYGVVFHRLLLREGTTPPWRELVRVYRRLEARGEVRGGRFVAGFSGEQYALPEAVQQLRAIRRKKPEGTLVTVNGADPLNLVGILTPGQRVPSLPSNRITYRDGVPIELTIGKSS